MNLLANKSDTLSAVKTSRYVQDGVVSLPFNLISVFSSKHTAPTLFKLVLVTCFRSEINVK